jgi:hypothetical protein
MKHIKLFEDFLNESINFKKIIGTRFGIEVGSITTTDTWNENNLIDKIEEVIKHNLFDADFYSNWTDNSAEYSKVFDKDTIKPLLKNIDKTLNDMFRFSGDRLLFNIEGAKAEEWIDKWFQTNKSISKSLKQDYYDYRDEYAGVKLK